MPRRSREGIWVILLLFLVLFLGVADNQIISPLLPAIRAQMGKSSVEVGYLFTGYAFAAGLSVLVWGPLSDRYGRKPGLLAGLSIFAVGSLTSSMSATFSALLAGRVITGMGASMLSLNTISYAADYFPYDQRGWAMGSIFSSYFAALILGVPVGAAIGDALGWNFVFAAALGLTLLLIATVGLLLPPSSYPGRGRGSRLQAIEHLRTYMGFFQRARTLGALGSSFFASAGTMGFMAFVGIWLHDQFGLSGSKIGLVFLATGAASLLASPFAGSLSDRIGKRAQFVASSLSLSLLLLALPGLAWGGWLFAVFGGISLAAAFRQGPLEALVTEVVPRQNRGSFVALKNSCSQLGIALAAVFSGMLYESGGYTTVCMFCASLTLVSALSMMLLVPRSGL